MNQLPRVAVIVETSKHYGRGVLMGICQYIKLHAPWRIRLDERGASDLEPSWLENWEGDGIISRSPSRWTAELASKRGIPLIGLAYHRELPRNFGHPIINCDHPATAKLVFEHFASRGFHSLGYCHATDQPWSEDRRDSFVKTASDSGMSVSVFDMQLGIDPNDAGNSSHRELCQWLQSLQKPCGLMACYDVFGAHILAACQELEIQVPDEIAVVGVDNDPLFCSVSYPQLSTVDQNVEKIGYEAARRLMRSIAGAAQEPADDPLTLIPPKELVIRASSDSLAIKDRILSSSLRFIRENSMHPISVEDVCKAANTSRRELERRFKSLLKTTPYHAILKTRLQRVCDLLIHTNDTLDTISESLNFADQSSLSRTFTRHFSMTPGEFRRRSAEQKQSSI